MQERTHRKDPICTENALGLLPPESILHYALNPSIKDIAYSQKLTVQRLDVQQEVGVVYTLHAGWFVNRTLGVFVDQNLVII